MIPLVIPLSDHYVEKGLKLYVHPYIKYKFISDFN